MTDKHGAWLHHATQKKSVQLVALSRKERQGPLSQRNGHCVFGLRAGPGRFARQTPLEKLLACTEINLLTVEIFTRTKRHTVEVKKHPHSEEGTKCANYTKNRGTKTSQLNSRGPAAQVPSPFVSLTTSLSSIVTAVHGERKAFCCCDGSARELHWHCVRSERGGPSDPELTQHASLISWQRRSIALWQLNATRSSPILKKKHYHFTRPNLPNDFSGPALVVVLTLFNTTRGDTCRTRAEPFRAHGTAVPPHVS